MAGAVDGVWQKHPAMTKRRKGASPTDGARVTPRMDAESERPPGGARQAVVFPIRSLGDKIFIHPKMIVVIESRFITSIFDSRAKARLLD